MFQPNQSDSAAPAAQRTKRQHLKDNASECLDQAEKPWKEYSMVSMLYMICYIQFWILSKSRVKIDNNVKSMQKWPAHSHTTSWHLQCYLVDLFFMCIPAYPPFLPSITTTHPHPKINGWFLFFLIGGFGIIFKKTLPPAFLQKTSKKLIRLSRTPTPPSDARNGHLTAAFVPPFGCPLGSKVRKHQASGWKMRLSGIPRCFFEGDHETKLVNLV